MCFTSCLLNFIFIAAWHCRVTACSEKSSLEIPWLLLVVCVLAQWLSDVWGVWNGSCSEHIQAPTVSADWSTVKDQIAICWPWCYTALSLSISYNTNCQMSRTFMNSHSSSHLEGTSKETRAGSITLNILSMQTHSWPKQNRLVWPVFQRNLQLKSLSPTFTGYCDDGRTGSKQFSLWAVE